MSKQTINPGNPPIVWSTIDEAFQKINSNFTELYLSIGGPGVDLGSISSSIIPDVDIGRDLGSPSKRWRDLYLGPTSLYLGNAQISANPDGTVNLPAGSKVGSELIRNPSESSFKTIRVSGNGDVVADDYQGILNLAGSFVSISTDPATDTVLITNTGVTSLNGSGAISVSSSTGNITITNTGVTALTAGTGISVSSPNGSVTIINEGVTELTTDPGSGITITATTGSINISNAAPNVNQDVFKFIDLGLDRLEPTGPTSVLTLIEGSGIDMSLNNVAKTLTIANNGVTGISVGSGLTVSSGTGNVTINLAASLTGNFVGDLLGSIFSDTSTMLVDGTGGRIVGPVYTSILRTNEVSIALGDEANAGNYSVSIGYNAGNTNQGDGTVALGVDAGYQNQGNYSVAVGRIAGYQNQAAQAVAIGFESGILNQGTNAIAIGYRAGYSNQTAGSIVLNASGAAQNAPDAGFYVNPIRSTATATGPMMYNPTTKELFYNTVLEFAGSTISTNDSSGIVVDVQTTFNTQVTVEGTLTVGDGISGYLSLNELKSVVAASSDFSDFKNRIAALM